MPARKRRVGPAASAPQESEPRLYIGVDPSNGSAGVAMAVVIDRAIVSYHVFSYSPWSAFSEVAAAWLRRALHEHPGIIATVSAEVPQHGAHESRAGVNQALGLVWKDLLLLLDTAWVKPRVLKRKYEPSYWRSVVFPDYRALSEKSKEHRRETKSQSDPVWKEAAKKKCIADDFYIANDDEAEAILILRTAMLEDQNGGSISTNEQRRARRRRRASVGPNLGVSRRRRSSGRPKVRSRA